MSFNCLLFFVPFENCSLYENDNVTDELFVKFWGSSYKHTLIYAIRYTII